MSAVEPHTDCWVVTDPKPEDKIGETYLVHCSTLRFATTRLEQMSDVSVSHIWRGRHPVIWLSEVEARRDARSRARCWRALRRCWARAAVRTLP